MKKLLKKLWEWIKAFYIKHQVIILHILNYIVLISIYGINTNPWVDAIIGVYVVFLFGMDMRKLFMKKKQKLTL